MALVDQKVCSLGQITAMGDEWKASQRVVVLCHGTFDLVHPGHLEHFRQARIKGDVLVVSVTSDRYVNKGPGRPLFPEALRAQMLAALADIDHVVIIDEPSAVPAIEAVRPNVYCKGPDYANADDGGNLPAEQQALDSVGGELVITEGETFSSSATINKSFSVLSAEAEQFLGHMREKYGSDGVLHWFELAKAAQVVALGEEIIDEYVYVVPEGKSPKDSIVTFRRTGVDRFDGGISVVAGHLRAVSKSVSKSNGGIPSIVKRRYVLQPFMQKVFSETNADKEIKREAPLETDLLAAADLALVLDYGHGLIRDREEASVVVEAANFLALSVQSNSLNWGFNLLTKWPSADYVVIDEAELRLATADRTGDAVALAQQEAKRLGTRAFVVTRGHLGALVIDSSGIVEGPALANRVVDRTGAGDAFISITTPLVWAGAPADVIAFAGNLAGALKVEQMGNIPLEWSHLRRAIRAILG
jgi:rfaE bifunctional protein nucleotidyltransferase chain/domain